MKMLLIIISLVLVGWRVEYYTKRNEFNEVLGMAPTRIESATTIARHGYKYKQIIEYKVWVSKIFVTIFASADKEKFSTISFLPRTPTISIRTPRGKVIKLKSINHAGEYGYSDMVHLEGNDRHRFISLIKQYKKLKVSIEGAGLNYVFDLNCNGFTRVYRKTGWR